MRYTIKKRVRPDGKVEYIVYEGKRPVDCSASISYERARRWLEAYQMSMR